MLYRENMNPIHSHVRGHRTHSDNPRNISRLSPGKSMDDMVNGKSLTLNHQSSSKSIHHPMHPIHSAQSMQSSERSTHGKLSFTQSPKSHSQISPSPSWNETSIHEHFLNNAPNNAPNNASNFGSFENEYANQSNVDLRSSMESSVSHGSHMDIDVDASIKNILEMAQEMNRESWVAPYNSPNVSTSKHFMDSMSSLSSMKIEEHRDKFTNADTHDTHDTHNTAKHQDSANPRKKKIKRLRVHTGYARNHVVFDSIRSLKWYSTDNPANADIMWVETTTRNNTITGLISNTYHKVSRFPGMQRCVSKHHMAKHLERMRRFFNQEYDFVPRTFLFPDDIQAIHSLEARYQNATYVVKPSQGSQGNGIFLTQNIKKSCLSLESKFKGTNTKYVIQEYLEHPYLLEGLKFDLRIYVLIESISPLKIFVYDEGLTRFCTEPYIKPSPSNLDRIYMHLSNYSLNKYNENFVESDDPNKGSKRNLAFLFAAIRKNGDDPQLLWNQIKDQIVKSCIAISPDLKYHYRAAFHHNGKQPSPISHCFQLLGFDFFVDQNLKPWLIELNHHPSLSIENPVDEIKRTLVCRAMKVVAFDILYKNLPEDQKEEKRKRYLAQYCKGWSYITQCDSVENARLQIFALDQLIDAYIYSCGPKVSNELGYQLLASKFYKFARDAGILDTNLARNPLSRVQLDLLFIEMNKRQSGTTSSFMAFDQFLDAVIILARKMYTTRKGKLNPQEELRCFLTFLSNHILTSKFKPESTLNDDDKDSQQKSYDSFYNNKLDRMLIKKRGYTSQTRARDVLRKDLRRQKTFVL